MTFAHFLLTKANPNWILEENSHLNIYEARHTHFISFEREWRKFQPPSSLMFFIN
jgi:hypothetical protein